MYRFNILIWVVVNVLNIGLRLDPLCYRFSNKAIIQLIINCHVLIWFWL